MCIPKGGIAFFDSGIGGLTVLAACEKYVPGELFYYYGDNTHAPYGNLPPEKIRQYVLEAFEKFRRLKVRAAVIACNTATAVCVEELRKKYDFPIVGAEPAVCIAAAKGGEVWVLTTRATFESERFRQLCRRASEKFPQAKIIPIACDRLAGEIERNLLVQNYDYTPFLPQGSPKAIVLGCTHYVYIEEWIKARYGCEIYHGNEGMVRRLLTLLGASNEKSRDERPPHKKRRSILGFLTTVFHFFERKEGNDIKANKSSHIKPLNPAKNKEKPRIVFLGKRAKNNRKIYKKTYVRKSLG